MDGNSPPTGRLPRVLIVSEHASTKFGGEAILPWHYFRFLRQRCVDVHLIVHSRTRDELRSLMPADADRMHFLPDTRLNIAAWKLSRFLPAPVANMTVGYLSRLTTQLAARSLAKQLVARYRIDIVHQPIPVSPREPSLLHGLGVPVVIGPMNGNMNFPPAFAHMEKRRVRTLVELGRAMSNALHRISPGKLRAKIMLVANERTRVALPTGCSGEVLTMFENGVDLQLWSPRTQPTTERVTLRLIFIGRLISLKAVDVLLDALARVKTPAPPTLEIIGDGPARAPLEAHVKQLGLESRVTFTGWQSQAETARRLREADVFAFPSLHDCGGAVVLEAMACGLPVIATRWGGPVDYIDPTCGALIAPDSRDALVEGFTAEISRLVLDAALRQSLGRAGRKRAEKFFNWKTKIDDILAIYRRALVP